MTTHIQYSLLWEKQLQLIAEDGVVFVDKKEFNRHHEGVWNSRVLAFVPQLCSQCTHTPQQHTVDGDCTVPDCYCEQYVDGVSQPDTATHFSDGTPVASYEGWQQ